ncbi:hypothetical protein E4U58_001016 [Claviceps cyperi]|nr:hypothetical protein E4U58_001016 [Claviceps cyperi]
MKHNTLSLAIAAAGAQQVAATFGLLNGLLGGNLGAGLQAGASFHFGSDFTHAPSFNTPHNVDNQCTPEQKKGWDFKDLPTGSFDKYLGFHFGGGWNCEASTRGLLQGRTFGNIAKIISGLCPLNGGLDIGLGAHAGVDAFSISSIDLSTEFDVRLEFHYDMQDGSICKHSADCKKGGSTIVNNQCGGAKKVRIVYPPQPSTIKSTCKISCHTISWHCGNGGSPPSSGQVSIPGTLTASGFSSIGSIHGVTTTPTTPDMETTGVTTSAISATTSPGQDTTPSYPGVTSAATSGTSSIPGASTDTTPGQETTPSIPGVTTSATSATTSPGQDITPSYPGATSSADTSGTSSIPGASTDTIPGTSTNTTPGQETTPSIPGVSTNTQPGATDVQSTQSTSEPATFATSISSAECHACSSTETSYLTVPGAVTTVQTGDMPQPTTPGGKPPPPCPKVVPRCLNTFMELKSKCKDNKDAACYCPNKDFVNAVFHCIYAHGENDNVISEAISFFQGMCGQYIPQNPAIATGCKPIIEIITVTGTPRITNVPYTTVAYSGPSAGPPAVVTVPMIAMPTMPTGPAAGAPPQPIAPVVAQPTAPGAQPTAPGAQPTAPGAQPTAPGAQPTAPAAGQPSVPVIAQPSMPAATPAGYTDAPGGSSPGASAPDYEPVTVPAASGTGAYSPDANPTGSVPVTAGAGRVGAGMMIAAAAFIAAL